MSKLSQYYYQDLKKLYQYLIPTGAKKINLAKEKPRGKYDYLILENTLAYKNDIQSHIQKLHKHCRPESRIIVIYFNFLWKPILDLATKLNFRKPDLQEPNWLSSADINNILQLENFELVKSGRQLLLPTDLGPVSTFINRYLARFPIINHFCLTFYQVYRPPQTKKDYSVSVIIPARNEAGNMKKVLDKIPPLGTKTEVIFVEGHSKDNTYQAIKDEISRYNGKISTSLYKQNGKGKADAVRLGYEKAKNDILMILDADLTVDPSHLPKFYSVISQGKAEFANGCRLVYPMEDQAMRSLNYLGNKFFSSVFSFLLSQSIKDTLCGTKVLLKTNYLAIKKNRKYFGDFDPFGDFDLIFGASKLNLKLVDIPIKYKNRTYGETNISRFSHGWLLIKMTIFAAKKLKFN